MRVMGYVSAFIDAVKNDPEKRFQNLVEPVERITQFQYAALLHDIGKIGVPEALLTKETRLNNDEWKNLEMRFRFILKDSVSNGGVGGNNEIDFIASVNRSGYLDDKNFVKLQKIKEQIYHFTDGTTGPLFTDTEWDKLSVRKGNLTDRERIAINSHATSTYRILSKIPWTKELEQIPIIAARHHERLDGSGYPDGFKAENICIESRVLAVVDIFESLVAKDRPYKPKVPVEKALDILRSDASIGKLDKNVVDFFIEKRIYETFVG
jgi:response regulator RpfG family c-di-GMP phosphodiesterase